MPNIVRRQEFVDRRRKTTHYKLPTINYKVKPGFTLIELLVVIAILGILATIAIASFTTAQVKGRDAKRKADINAISKALELASSDTRGGSYPRCPFNNASCQLDPINDTENPTLTPTYIKKLPQDPSGGQGNCTSLRLLYCYFPNPPACNGTTGTLCTSYSLTACLENDKEPTSFFVKATAVTVCASGLRYEITNP